MVTHYQQGLIACIYCKCSAKLKTRSGTSATVIIFAVSNWSGLVYKVISGPPDIRSTGSSSAHGKSE